MSGLVVGLDAEHVDERRADHDLRDLLRDLPVGTVRVTATHWAVLGERPHVALSAELGDGASAAGVSVLVDRVAALAPRWAVVVGDAEHGDVALRAAAAAARDAHVQRRSGRVVHFPGAAQLVGTLTVQELLERSAVDRVRVLTAGDAPPDARVVTRGHVRPTWVDGELVLLTHPPVGGTLVPFESPSPTACCVDH